MLGGEAAEEFGNVLLRVISVDELLLDGSHLGHLCWQICCALASAFSGTLGTVVY